MDRNTLSEVRRYQKPPKILHEIVKAMLLLLGEDEMTTEVLRHIACIEGVQTQINIKIPVRSYTHYLNFCAAGLGTLQDATEPERDAAQAGTEHEGAHFQASHCPPRDRRQGATNPRAPGIPDSSQNQPSCNGVLCMGETPNFL